MLLVTEALYNNVFPANPTLINADAIVVATPVAFIQPKPVIIVEANTVAVILSKAIGNANVTGVTFPAAIVKPSSVNPVGKVFV